MNFVVRGKSELDEKDSGWVLSFVKVKSLDNFATLVGNMLQAEIRRM